MTAAEVVEYSLSWEHDIRLTARVAITDTDEPQFTFIERLTATRCTHFGGMHGDDPNGHYWLVSGDNTGSQQLIVWPYHLDALIATLQELKAGEQS